MTRYNDNIPYSILRSGIGLDKTPPLDKYAGRTDFDEAVIHMFRNVQGPKIRIMFRGALFGVWDRPRNLYFIHRWPDRHFFRKWQSYGVSECILTGLKHNSCEAVILIEHGRSGLRTYVVNIHRFFSSGLSLVNTDPPREKQLHVRLSDWTPETGRWKPEDIERKIEPDVLRITPE